MKSNLRANELKFHINCCGGLTELTVGFSRASPHMSEEVNPDYDPQQALVYNNFPKKVAKRSTAYRFQMALKALKDESFTDKLFKKYYDISANELLSQ
ncbi:hypothetical protein [Psychromonas hadalis]|uniref:hypothetical protein n=1 Tax=Psychromonas hadalis TaxID=211669 RepID=UPI0012EC878E|nr:hypothetical protein [Psychromonas hadalis]